MSAGIAWPLSISTTFAILIFGIAWMVQRQPGRAFHLSSWLAVLALYWAVVTVGISERPSGNATDEFAGWAFGAGGCSVWAIHLIARARKATWPRSVRVPMGVVCIVAALVLPTVNRSIIAYVIAVASAAFGAGVVIRQVKREHEALAVLRKQLVDASEWKEAVDDPELGDNMSTVGLWNGTRIWLDCPTSGIRARSTSIGWPRGLLVLPERTAAKGTGDDAFDRLFSVQGEEVDRRGALTAAIRAQLVELAKIAKCSLRNQTIEIVTAEPDLATQALDGCVRLSASLPGLSDDQMRRVFDATRNETHAVVRAGGYRWLIAQTWQPQEVYEAASADADTSIAAWGREHLPYRAGAFR